MDFNFSFEGFS